MGKEYLHRVTFDFCITFPLALNVLYPSNMNGGYSCFLLVLLQTYSRLNTLRHNGLVVTLFLQFQRVSATAFHRLCQRPALTVTALGYLCYQLAQCVLVIVAKVSKTLEAHELNVKNMGSGCGLITMHLDVFVSIFQFAEYFINY